MRNFGSPLHRHRIRIRCISTFHLAEKHVSFGRTSKPPPPTPCGLAPDSVPAMKFEPGRGFRVGDQSFLAALCPGTGLVLFFRAVCLEISVATSMSASISFLFQLFLFSFHPHRSNSLEGKDEFSPPPRRSPPLEARNKENWWKRRRGGKLRRKKREGDKEKEAG